MDMAGFSSQHLMHECGFRHRHVLFDGGRPALGLALASGGTEVMGFIHAFGNARMPIWGVSAISSNLLLVVLTRGGHRGLYLLSFFMLFLFAVTYNRLSNPINRLQTEASKRQEHSRMPENCRRHGIEHLLNT